MGDSGQSSSQMAGGPPDESSFTVVANKKKKAASSRKPTVQILVNSNREGHNAQQRQKQPQQQPQQQQQQQRQKKQNQQKGAKRNNGADGQRKAEPSLNHASKNQQAAHNPPKATKSSPAPKGMKRKPALGSMQLGDLAPQLSSSANVRRGNQSNTNQAPRTNQAPHSKQTAAAQQRSTEPHTQTAEAPPAARPWGPANKPNNVLQRQLLKHSGQPKPPPQPQNQQPKQKQQPSVPSAKPNAWNTQEFPSLRPSGGLNPSAKPWQLQQPTAEPSQPKPTAAASKPAPNANGDEKSGAKGSGTAKKPKEKKPKPDTSASKPNNKKKGASSPNPKPSSIADMFSAKQRPASDDHHGGGNDDALQLLHLMQEGKVASANKGRGHRQRIRPRSKKFSTLKKHVLKERLRQWQVANPSKEDSNAGTDDNAKPDEEAKHGCTVCVLGFAEAELLEDDDEYEELMSNLKDMAVEVAPHNSAFIPRTLQEHEVLSAESIPVFVRFVEERGAEAAVSCWNGMNLGGQRLQADRSKVPDVNDSGGEEFVEAEWQKQCLEWFRSSADGNNGAPANAQVILEDVLTEDDLEDEDCLEESLQDIRVMAEKYGSVAEVQANREDKSVLVSFQGGAEMAKRAAENMGKTVLGGSAIVARLHEPENDEKCSILLNNALSEDDLEDEECLEESLADLQELASKYGPVASIGLVENTSSVKIVFAGSKEIAKSAESGFRGMVIGGVAVEVIVLDSSGVESKNPNAEERTVDEKEGTEAEAAESSTETKQMFSGEKLIGENWAECKRAPKIPNGANPRRYAVLVDNETVKPLLIEMLGELMRLQKRAVIENKNTKRRIIMGLREVAKGVRTRKVKMVIMANNLDEYGAIDDKLQEILDLSHQEDIPVFFEFSKRTLGKAIGKSIKVAVVGVQNPEGAYQEFKKLVKLQPPHVAPP